MANQNDQARDAGAAAAASSASAILLPPSGGAAVGGGIAPLLSSNAAVTPPPSTNNDARTDKEWMVSFAATMVPFAAFCYGHSRGATVRVVEAVVKSPVGVYGLLLLPFGTLAMEKCIYDTVQSIQGIDPKITPSDRGGFPSGGGAALPSFSLVAVRK